jgi:hypothetical protein
MKKSLTMKAIFFTLAIFMTYSIQAQVFISTTPDSTAVLNESYSYDVDALTLPPGTPVVFSLDQKPTGMTINSTTGVISWVPTSINQGTKVVVKASIAGNQSVTQSYYIYITDAVACPANLTSYWGFESKEGSTIPDLSGTNDAQFVGIATNEPVLVNGKVGKAAQFNPTSASSSYYEIPDNDQFDWIYDNSFTISVWFKNRPNAIPDNPETLIGRASGANSSSWTLQWVPSNSNKVGLFIQSSNSEDTIAWNDHAINDTNWHHAAVVFSGSQFGQSTIIIYIDNIRQTTFKTFGVTKFDNTTPITIGYWAQYGQTYPFSGNIDEVAIYGTGLTNAQIADLYSKGLTNKPICQEGNFTPIITSVPVNSGTQDVAYSYTLKARDLELTPLTKTAPVKPSWLSFNTSTGVLSGTPLNKNVGDTTVTLRVSDGLVSVDQTFALNIVNVNDAPVISSTPAEAVNEDVAYLYTFAAQDPDLSDGVTLSAPVLPSWLSFNATSGVLSGTPTNTQVGYNDQATFDVTLRATDHSNLFTEQTFTITVTNINDAPVINSQDPISTNEDVAVEITPASLNVTDVDNIYPDEFTFTVGEGDNYTLSGNTVTPDLNWNGDLTVPVEIFDGLTTLPYDLTVTVTPVNDLPVFISDPVLTANIGENYQYWVSAEDVEDQTLTITCPTKPAWLTISANGNSAILQGTPAASDEGDHSIVLQVTDGGSPVQQSFTITVNPATGINDKTAEFARVYPVPSSDFVYFDFAEKLDKASLEVFTMNGVLVKKLDVSGQTRYQLDVKDLKSSQYYYRLITSDKTQNGSIIVK